MLIGHLGRDGELKYTTSGSAVVNFSLATTDTWKDKTTGEKQERTEWHRIAYFGKGAEAVAEYLTKGKPVYVEGSIQTREYEKDGEKKYSTEIRADRVQLLGSKGGGGAKSAESDIPF